jgi:hypothetical protein
MGRGLPFALISVGYAPQRDRQSDSFKPCVIHLLNVFSRVPFLARKGLIVAVMGTMNAIM